MRCRECFWTNRHAPGCPEDDGGEEEIEIDGEEPQEKEVPEYNVEWDGSRLRCVRN